MKFKYSEALILLLIIVVNTSIPIIQAQINPGDVLQFKILKSKITATINTNTITVKGFNFCGKLYPEKTPIKFLVNMINGGINGNYTIDNRTYNQGFSSTWYEYLIPHAVFYTSRITIDLILNWAYHDFSKGNYLFLAPYIHPSFDSWNYFILYNKSLKTDLQNFELLGYPLDYNVIFQNNFDTIYFESWVGGEANHLFGKVFGCPFDFSSDVSFGNQFQIKFSKISGLVEGYRVRGWIDGTINGSLAKVSLDYHYETDGYSLPRFSIGQFHDFFPKSYLYFIFLPAIIIILFVSIIFIRYNRKRIIKRKKQELTINH